MPERTAAEVLANKIAAIRADLDEFGFTPLALAKRLAEDPAITVRTDMVVERFVVEFHYDKAKFRSSVALHNREQVHHVLTSYTDQFHDDAGHRIIVRPYPENNPS